jgi:hypothetical protein
VIRPAWLKGGRSGGGGSNSSAKASIDRAVKNVSRNPRCTSICRGKIRFPQEAYPRAIQSYLATALQPFAATSVKIRGRMSEHEILCLTLRIAFWLPRNNPKSYVGRSLHFT